MIYCSILLHAMVEDYLFAFRKINSSSERLGNFTPVGFLMMVILLQGCAHYLLGHEEEGLS